MPDISIVPEPERSPFTVRVRATDPKASVPEVRVSRLATVKFPASVKEDPDLLKTTLFSVVVLVVMVAADPLLKVWVPLALRVPAVWEKLPETVTSGKVLVPDPKIPRLKL